MDDFEALIAAAQLATGRGELGDAERLLEDAALLAGDDERLAARLTIEAGYLRQVSSRDGVGDFPALAAPAIATLERYGDHASLAVAWKALARAHFVAGRAHAAEEACAASIEHSRRAGRAPSAYVLYLRGVALLAGPAPLGEAAAYARARLEAGDVHPSGPLAVLAECAAMNGDFADARALAAEVRAAYAELGRNGPAIVGEVELLAGNAAAAERDARTTYERERDAGDVGHAAGEGVLLGRALLALGRDDEAAALADELERIAPPADLQAQIGRRSIAARARGDAQLAYESLALADTTEWTDVRARTRVDVALVTRESQPLADAIALFGAKGNVVERDRASALLGEL